MEVEKKDCALFLGLIGLKKSWRSKKRHAAAENKMDQSRGLEKDISGSKKRAALIMAQSPLGANVVT